VFDMMSKRAVRLCGGAWACVPHDGGCHSDGGRSRLKRAGLGKVQQFSPRPASNDTIAGQVMLSQALFCQPI